MLSFPVEALIASSIAFVSGPQADQADDHRPRSLKTSLALRKLSTAAGTPQ